MNQVKFLGWVHASTTSNVSKHSIHCKSHLVKINWTNEYIVWREFKHCDPHHHPLTIQQSFIKKQGASTDTCLLANGHAYHFLWFTCRLLSGSVTVHHTPSQFHQETKHLCKLMKVWMGWWVVVCLKILFICAHQLSETWNLNNPLRDCFNWVFFAVISVRMHAVFVLFCSYVRTNNLTILFVLNAFWQ